MKFGVLVFPGSNCDHDTYHVIAEMARQPVTYLWHDSADLQGCDAILVPGGFAYGDYLRTGAIAHFSPVMQSVKRFAADGGPGAGHLQWISDSVRVGTAAGRADAQCGAEVHLQAGASAHGNDQLAVYAQAEEGRGAADSDWAHGRQLLLRRGHAGRAASARTGSRFATRRRKARLRRRRTRTGRWTTLPEC